jgi:GNAT superfamily N-acetyltransferase
MQDSLTPADAPAAALISADFGWPHRVEDWAMALALGRGVAWREAGELLGTAVLFPVDSRHATIGLVQVAPSLQGNGIGRRLMEAAIGLGEGRNLRLHATTAGAGLYAKLGFEARGVVQQWQGVASHAGSPPSLAALDAVRHRDRAATGLDREALLRTLFAAGTAYADDAGGYAIRRSFGRGTVIGPVIAASETAAAALVAGLARPGFLRLDIPAERVGLAATLAGMGLASVEDVTVMVRGTWPDSPGLFALSSQAMG